MPRLGVLSKFYVNVGNFSVPSWLELPMISDCNVDGSWDEGDASARTSRVKVQEPTMMGVEVSGKVRVKDAVDNAGYINMYNAYYRDSVVEVLVMNGPLNENGAEGYRFQAKVFAWSEDQSLGAVLFKDFTIKPCIPDTVANHPRMAKVVGGTLVYSAIGQGA